MRIIAFAGSKTAGKDTAARSLLSRNSLVRPGLFVQANFADTLKNACELIFGFTQAELNDPALKEIELDRWPHKQPREVMRNVAKLFRTMYSQDIWVRAWLRRVPTLTAQCIVVTDLRHEEELAALRELGAKIIFIDNPKVNEERRKGIEAGEEAWLDPSETFVDALKLEADVVITNDASLNELYGRTQQAVLDLFGDWNEWSELATVENAQQKDIIL